MGGAGKENAEPRKKPAPSWLAMAGRIHKGDQKSIVADTVRVRGAPSTR